MIIIKNEREGDEIKDEEILFVHSEECFHFTPRICFSGVGYNDSCGQIL